MWEKIWIQVNDLSGGRYPVNKNIRFETWMLKSDLCDSNDAYFIVKWRIRVKGSDNANRRNKKLIFKNNQQLRSCVSKINSTFIDSTEDLDIATPCSKDEPSFDF